MDWKDINSLSETEQPFRSKNNLEMSSVDVAVVTIDPKKLFIHPKPNDLIIPFDNKVQYEPIKF